MQSSVVIPKHIEEGFVGQKMIVLPPNVEKAIVSNPLINTIYLTAIGYYPNAIYHDIERKTGCDQYIVIYCIAGEGVIQVLDKSFKLVPNTFFIIPKCTHHSYRSSLEKPWSIYWVHFNGIAAENLYKRSLVNNELQVHPLAYDESKIKLFNHIFSTLEHSYGDKDMEIVNISLLYFLSSIIYYKETDTDIYETDAVSQSIHFMKENLEKKLTVDELSKQQNLSTSHYIRIFKQRVGLSPINYFNQLKIQKSCQYLYFTYKSIKEICVEVGFDDPYYFSRQFRKEMGMSPSKYKKIYRK